MQAAGPELALVTGETVRLRFSVKGYDAPESWDIYWTGRQVGTYTDLLLACLPCCKKQCRACPSEAMYVIPEQASCYPPLSRMLVICATYLLLAQLSIHLDLSVRQSDLLQTACRLLSACTASIIFTAAGFHPKVVQPPLSSWTSLRAYLLLCLLYSNSAYQLQNCERALTQVHPGQRVNCIPGILSLSQKHRLVATLTSHYGEGAFELIPRSWLLPSRYWHWRLWAEAQVRLLPPLINSLLCITLPRSAFATPHHFDCLRQGQKSCLSAVTTGAL